MKVLGFLFVALCATTLAAAKPVVLERLSQTYLPFEFTDAGAPRFCMGEAAAEQLSFDPKASVLYVSGNGLVRAVDVSDPSKPETLVSEEVPGEVTDVLVCGDFLAVTIVGDPESLPGSLLIYSTHKKGSPMELKHNVTTGSLPDAVTFTPDCSMVLTADEGEAGLTVDGEFANPEGSVTIVDLAALEDGASNNKAVKKVNFRALNRRADKLVKDGVRWIWRGQTLEEGAAFQTLSKDLEPEQIIVTKDGKTAYVNLQENNAIAVLDLESMKFTAIRPLALKDFGEEGNALDTSKEDGGPSLQTYKGLYGMLQPDVITFFNHKGEDYIVTANEGDAKEYLPEDHNVTEWLEFAKGAEFVGNTTEDFPEETAEALSDPALLAGLKISRVDGVANTSEDGGNVYDKLLAYGGRSWSIFKASDMSLVYDSGNDFETVIAKYFPWAYNADGPGGYCAEVPESESPAATDLDEPFIDELKLQDLIEAEELKGEAYAMSPDPESEGLEEAMAAFTQFPNSTADDRSTSRGPEPEAVAIGNLDDRRLAVVTVERGGVLFVYDISDPIKPVWQSAIYPGAHDALYAELYNRKVVVDIDPEGVEFVSAEDSPTGEPLLMVSGAESGTFSIYRVTTSDVKKDCDGEAVVEEGQKHTLVVSTTTEC